MGDQKFDQREKKKSYKSVGKIKALCRGFFIVQLLLLEDTFRQPKPSQTILKRTLKFFFVSLQGTNQLNEITPQFHLNKSLTKVLGFCWKCNIWYLVCPTVPCLSFKLFLLHHSQLNTTKATLTNITGGVLCIFIDKLKLFLFSRATQI